MRDTLIEEICGRMRKNKKIFFLSGDLGAAPLDKLRQEFKDRFVNVGIAEQNLINIAAGLALEGFVVYAYGLAPFITMRCYEQIRNNLSLLSRVKRINVNIIGLGAGVSYDISGPTHHCLEDIAIMRLLPNFEVFSPSDSATTKEFVDYSINIMKPKYIRLDGKPLPDIYGKRRPRMKEGFCELIQGRETCLVSTGYMTHRALKVSEALKGKICTGVVDIFLLKPVNEDLLSKCLAKYKSVITLEEAFIGNGGLDSLVSGVINDKNLNIKIRKIGFKDKYMFGGGGRDYLHKLAGLDQKGIINIIKEFIHEA